MNRSEKSALFVFLTLLVALLTGLGLYFKYADTDAVLLLVGFVLAAFFLVVITVRLVMRLQQAQRLANEYGAPDSKLLRILSRRQWLTLLVGLTVIAISAGSLTAVRVVIGGTPTAQPLPLPTTTPAAIPPPTTPLTTPTPTDSPSPTGDASPSESGPPTPSPGSTTYLDSVNVLDGYYRAGPVTFSAKHYQRGFWMSCYTATSSHLQWNVAGHTKFSAVAGIDDATEDAFGKVVGLLFYDQDGRLLVPKAVEVSVGHPKEITIDLTGVVSLRMTCAARDAKTNAQRSTYASFGDAIIVRA